MDEEIKYLKVSNTQKIRALRYVLGAYVESVGSFDPGDDDTDGDKLLWAIGCEVLGSPDGKVSENNIFNGDNGLFGKDLSNILSNI